MRLGFVLSALLLATSALAQTLAVDPSFAYTSTGASFYKSVTDATLDGKNRLFLLERIGLSAQAITLTRTDVNGGIDASFPVQDLGPRLPSGAYGFDGALNAVEGDQVEVVGSAYVGPATGGVPSGPRFAFIGRFDESGTPNQFYGPTGVRALSLPFSPSVGASLIDGGRTYVAVRNEDAATCAIVAILPGGYVDSAFGVNGVATLTGQPDCTPRDLIVADGRLLLLATRPAGTTTGGTSLVWAVRTDGRTATGFGASGVRTLSLPSQTLELTQLVRWRGGIALAGRSRTVAAPSSNSVVTAVLTSAGALDASFAGGSGIDVQPTTVQLTASSSRPVGLTVRGETLISATPVLKPGPPPPPNSPAPQSTDYGFLTTIYTPAGVRVAQSGPDGFGFVAAYSYSAGGRLYPLLSAILVTDSQGRIVVAASRVYSGSGIQTSEAYRFVLTSPVATATTPDDVLASLSVAPNPVAAAGAVTLRLEAPGEARVTVLDALGRTVAVLADGMLGAGPHRLRLDASALPAGVYAVVARIGGQQTVRRITVAR